MDKRTLMKSILLPLFLIPSILLGQMVVTDQVNLPVFRENHSEIINPWTGGINAAQISMFDADNDGENNDIFLFDKAGDRIMIFTGEDVNGERVYQYKPGLTAHFPELNGWALLRDNDCDGKMDIFTYSSIGGAFAVYRNTSSETGISFELVTTSILSEYEFNTSQFTSNIYVSSQDIPAVFDFDGDGDLDIMTFGVSGSLVELHLNFSIENTGVCGLDDFKLKNRCYGRFIEGGESNGIITDPEIVESMCGFNIVDPRSVRPDPTTGTLRHMGSTLLAFDANADGLPDIVIGDVTYTNLTYLENSDRGDDLVDSVVLVVPTFPDNFGGVEVDVDNFPASFYEDVSGDGIRDLLVSPNNPYVALNKNSVWYYKNIGEDNLPVFDLAQTDFLQDETIDYGEGSVPVLFDYNGDDLMDLVVASRGVYLGDAHFKPALSLFINTGTASAPEFTLLNDDWLNVSNLGLGQYVYPTFGDLDGDGDIDMIIGDISGGVFEFQNSAGPGNPANFSLVGSVLADGASINVGQSSTPQLFDLTGNGLLDLIIGERNGNLNFYKNIGTNSQPEFTLITDSLGGVSSTVPPYFIGSSSPMFYRFNNSTYLAVGSENGKIFQYDDIDNNLDGNFNLMSNQAFNINAGMQSKPFVYDINSDGLPDVLCGGIGGGVRLFFGDYLVGVQGPASAKKNLKIYPNPVDDILSFDFPSESRYNHDSYFSIYSSDGRKIESGSLINDRINVQKLPSGLYLLKLNSGNEMYVGKFVKK